MKIYFRIMFFALIIFLMAGAANLFAAALRYAALGDFSLENGKIIRECRIAYRLLGKINGRKSNVLLMPTWLAGTTQELADLGFIGPGRMVDTSKYHVIAVDAFANGLSSSPSNSKLQPGLKFPQFSIDDMVRAQHILLTKHLNIHHLYAVIGISMGGMQAFQWMVTYPDFMEKAVAIVATPWMTSYDLLVWTAELRAITAAVNCGAGGGEAMKAVYPIHLLTTRTPRYCAEATGPADFVGFITASEKRFMQYNVFNWQRQLEAIMSHNILRYFGSSAEKAAAAVRAKALVITSAQDHAVYPEPAQNFAKLVKAEIFELTGDCGHFAFLCEQERLHKVVGEFMDNDPR